MAIGASAAEPNQGISFNRDIRPIIADHCFHCHGPDPSSRKAKLRFDREDGFFTPRDEKTPPTVVKGKPEESEFWHRISTSDEDDVMPPTKEHKDLKPEEKDLLKRWIAAGAPWQPHWSFVPARQPDLPPVRNSAWVRNDIDRFILAKLQASNLTPAPEADGRTLVRRLSLDLTGLPPEPEVVEAFLKDTSPKAYENLVDRLLASPRYGEHRARYWLDAARYGDTHGLHFDNYREMWPYRDWVINAYNRNQPFDQFTIEQIAGDLLPNPTRDQLIATGFHRCNITTNEGGTIVEENLANYARDRVETTSWVWLGLTTNCAACHDHKFDPITQKEFYSLSAYFRNTTQEGLDKNIRDSAPVLILPKSADENRWQAIPGESAALASTLTDMRKKLRTEFDSWLATATKADWDGKIAGLNPMDVLVPVETAAAKNGISATIGGKIVVVAAAITPTWEDGGVLGKALHVTRGNDVSLTGSAAAELPQFEGDKPFTISCWLKLPKEQQGSGTIIGRMDDKTPTKRGWDLSIQGDEFTAHLISSWPQDALKVRTTGKALQRDRWQHISVTYDGLGKAAGFTIFVDGKKIKLELEAKSLTGPTLAQVPVTIGQRTHGEPLASMLIRDVRLAKRLVPVTSLAFEAATLTAGTLLAMNPKDRDLPSRDALFDIWKDGESSYAALIAKQVALDKEMKEIKGRSAVTPIQEEVAGSKAMAYVLYRGEYDKKKEQVEPGVFAFLAPLPADAPKNRLALGRWLVSQDNALTPRVVVNRMWQEIFGIGLVRTAEDFGIMGEAPSHPELLDYLAVSFRNGWNVKQTIKLIVMSATYRQSAVSTPEKNERDPANRLISHGPRFRMDAEMVRDYALAVSGLLSPTIGGPSVKTYQPDGVWDVVGMPEGNTRIYKRDSGESLYRRSMYWFWKRMAPPASLEIMNAPNRETSCVRRERTNTPLQALVTLNDPQFIEAARVLAERAIKNDSDLDRQLSYISARVLSRTLAPRESAALAGIYGKLHTHYQAMPAAVKELLSVGDHQSDPKLDPTALSALTMTCNAMLNLDEALNL